MGQPIQSELVLAFRNWIFSQDRDAYQIRSEEPELIEIITNRAKAEIRFYEMNVVEFRILENDKEDPSFYLHFQLNDMDHAKGLFDEMIDSLLAIEKNVQVKILLCCTSALTTSYFAEKLNEAAQMLSLHYVFKAVSYDHVYEEGLYYDMILLAPQIAFQLKAVHNAMSEIPIMAIPAHIFGAYDAGAMIELIKEKLAEQKPARTKTEIVAEKFDNTAKILCIGVFNSSRRIRTIYRYYRNGEIADQGEVIKKNIQLKDIEDIIAAMTAIHPEIECIGLTMPGTAVKGRLYLPESGFNDENIAQEIYQKYGIFCVLSNDCNQVAEGINAMEEKYDNLIFYFQPYGSPIGGAGIVVNGNLVKGRNNAAGEIRSMQESQKHSADLTKLCRTAEGTYEIVISTCASLISVLAPDALLIHSAMTPDIEHIRQEVARVIPAHNMPEFIYVNDMREYMMVGTLLKSLKWLEVFRSRDKDNPYWQR